VGITGFTPPAWKAPFRGLRSLRERNCPNRVVEVRDYVYPHVLPEAKTVTELLPFWFEDYNTFPISGLR
jgi:hypothetical protein